MLRLDLRVPPTAPEKQSRLGAALSEDKAGYPNGRRPNDDVTDITIRVAGGTNYINAHAGDGVNFLANAPGVVGVDITANGIAKHFPFLPTPYDGKNRRHVDCDETGPGANPCGPLVPQVEMSRSRSTHCGCVDLSRQPIDSHRRRGHVSKIVSLAPLLVRPVRQRSFSAAEWRRLAALYAFVGFLHLLGWGTYLHYAAGYPALVGLGFVAYMFGLRHAFDADHIAAVDDTVRFMLQKGKQPLGVGFFFSLGHSTVVLALAVGIAFAATAVKAELPQLKSMGAIIGASVSGSFLWIIGILNLLVLLDILKIWRSAKKGTHSHAHLEALLQKRGLLNRLFGGRLQKLMNHSWQMYPLGLLFGLGFDTASEVGLLAMTAGASAGDLPVPAVLVPARAVCSRNDHHGYHRRGLDVEGL